MALYLGWKLIKYYERAAGKKFPAAVVFSGALMFLIFGVRHGILLTNRQQERGSAG